MPSSNKTKRRYIRPASGGTKHDQIVYLVYKQEEQKLTSDGPYENLEEAQKWMRDLLLTGVCAWVVSYNA